MKSLYIVFLSVLGSCSMVCAQNAAANLSSLNVMDVVDPSTNELNSFLIELTANNPQLLNRLEIILEDVHGLPDPPLLFNITAHGEKLQVEIGSNTFPFESNMLRFLLPVRDQLVMPYRKIFVKAFDKEGKPTNQLNFIRSK